MNRAITSVCLAASVLWASPLQAQTEPAQQPMTAEQYAQANFEVGVQFLRDKKYASAVESFERAAEARPDFFQAHSNSGVALAQWAKETIQPEERFHRLQAATEKFGRAAELRPNDKATQLLWSETLVLLGDMPLDGRLRLACYQGAIEKARKAAEVAPDDWEAYNKWAVILTTKLSEFAVDDSARVQLFKEAAGLFGKAAERARYSGERGSAFANWASSLLQAARITTDRNAKQSLMREALDKFERSARILPNAHGTYAMWGTALIELGKLTRVRGDFREAIDKLNTSLALKPNDPAVLYNLACAYALMENPVMAVKNLKACFENDITNTYRGTAAQDADLASLRGHPDFDELFGTRRPTTSMPIYNPPLRDSPR